MLTVVAATLVVGPPAARAVPPPGLAISVPGTAALGTVAPGGVLTASLGPVQVTTAGSLGPGLSWTATVSTTAFTGPSGRSVPASSASYSPGPAQLTGVAPGVCTPGTAGALGSARTAYGCTVALFSGTTTVTWNPTLTLTIGPQALAGNYSGVITHSVA